MDSMNVHNVDEMSIKPHVTEQGDEYIEVSGGNMTVIFHLRRAQKPRGAEVVVRAIMGAVTWR